MKGIVYNGTTTELVDGLTLRAPGPREVVVQVAAAGLCHSDISYMSGMYPVTSPGVCGNEAARVVAESWQCRHPCATRRPRHHRHTRRLRILPVLHGWSTNGVPSNSWQLEPTIHIEWRPDLQLCSHQCVR